jgi:hypothetical protein
MFDIRPDNDVPGFRVKPFDIQSGDDVPGFRVKATEDVPGFRVPGDGSPRPTFMTGGLPSQEYVNVNSTHPYLRGGSSYPDATIMEKIRDPDWLAPRLGATFEGAISTIPGVWSLVRGIGRAAGVGGKDEAHRFDDEIKAAGTLAGKALDKAVEYPELAARAVGEVASELNKDPLFKYHMFGRMLAGSLVGIGPVPLGVAAGTGDVLRAIEKGYGMRDIVREAIEGNPWLRGLGK